MLPRFLLLTGPAFAGLLPLLTAKRRVGVASALICTPRWDKADRWGAESFFLLPSACEYATYYVAWKTKPQSKKKKQIKYQKQSALSLHGKIKKRVFPAYNGNLEIWRITEMNKKSVGITGLSFPIINIFHKDMTFFSWILYSMIIYKC